MLAVRAVGTWTREHGDKHAHGQTVDVNLSEAADLLSAIPELINALSGRGKNTGAEKAWRPPERNMTTELSQGLAHCSETPSRPIVSPAIPVRTR